MNGQIFYMFHICSHVFIYGPFSGPLQKHMPGPWSLVPGPWSRPYGPYGPYGPMTMIFLKNKKCLNRLVRRAFELIFTAFCIIFSGGSFQHSFIFYVFVFNCNISFFSFQFSFFTFHFSFFIFIFTFIFHIHIHSHIPYPYPY